MAKVIGLLQKAGVAGGYKIKKGVVCVNCPREVLGAVGLFGGWGTVRLCLTGDRIQAVWEESAKGRDPLIFPRHPLPPVRNGFDQGDFNVKRSFMYPDKVVV